MRQRLLRLVAKLGDSAEDLENVQVQICSLLPSATEILYALGLGPSVAAVTFECDFPAEVATKPIVIHTGLGRDLAPAEIDRRVEQYVSQRRSLYQIDFSKLEQIQPDLILTQELCDVCAISASQLARTLHQLSSKPRIISLTPHTLEDVLQDILRVGEATDRHREAQQLITSLGERIMNVRQKWKKQKPTVVCLEWLSPPFNAGHWIPEMIVLAGGVDPLGQVGKDSCRIEWNQVLRVDPDVVLVMPCGHNLERAAQEYRATQFPEEWKNVKAVRNGRVYAVNASAYFSRPGPRLVAGLEILHALLQQEWSEEIPANSWLQL